MSDVDEVNFEADKPAKKKARKPAKAKAAAKVVAKQAFPGLTRTVCAEICSAKACAISGKPYCAHPTKGGLQAADSNDRAANDRLQSARDQIGVRIDRDRFQ